MLICVIRRWAGKLPGGGIYGSLNKGIQSATGEVFGVVHRDGLFVHDEVVERIAAEFAGPAVFSNLDYMTQGKTGQLIRP